MLAGDGTAAISSYWQRRTSFSDAASSSALASISPAWQTKTNA